MSSRYAFKVKEGRCVVYIDGLIAFMFNQLDFKGLYAFKDDVSLYGLDIYLMSKNGGSAKIPVHFKTRAVWEHVLRLLDENLVEKHEQDSRDF